MQTAETQKARWKAPGTADCGQGASAALTPALSPRRGSAARSHDGQPKLINAERAMDITGNRKVTILTTDYTDERGSRSDNRPHPCPSPPGEGEATDAPRGYWGRPQPSAACGHSGAPKLINSERAVQWGNPRLCSPMFAFVRLI